MVTYYNRKDLVSLGIYLLSKEREKLIKDNHPDTGNLDNALRSVHHADIENWLETLKK